MLLQRDFEPPSVSARGLTDDSEMGSKLLFAGNILALVITIAAFLQAVSWPIAGALVVASLGAALFFYAKQNMPSGPTGEPA